MKYGCFTMVALALLLAGCGKKERFPQTGEPAVLFRTPRGWQMKSFNDASMDDLEIYSPDKTCWLKMTLVTNPASNVFNISYQRYADTAEKNGFKKVGPIRATELSGLKGASFQVSRQETGWTSDGQTRIFRLDAAHLVVLKTLAASNAPKANTEALEKLADSVEIVRGATPPLPTPDERTLELREKAIEAHVKKDYAAELKCWDAVQQLTPNEASVYYFRQYDYYKTGRYEEAFADLDKALALDPNMVGAYKSRGYLYLRKSELDKALADFDEYLKREPNDAAGFVDRGVTLLRLKQYDRALADFAEAIRLDPKRALAYCERGRLFTKTGEHEKALADFAKALELSPGDANSLFQRSTTYWQMGEYEKCAADREATLQSLPEDPFYLNNAAWFYAVCPKPEVRNGARAVELAMKACTITEWGNAGYIDTLAAAEAEAGKWDEAVSYEKLALKMMEQQGKDAQSLKNFQERLELYEKKQPYQETTPQQ